MKLVYVVTLAWASCALANPIESESSLRVARQAFGPDDLEPKDLDKYNSLAKKFRKKFLNKKKNEYAKKKEDEKDNLAPQPEDAAPQMPEKEAEYYLSDLMLNEEPQKYLAEKAIPVSQQFIKPINPWWWWWLMNKKLDVMMNKICDKMGVFKVRGPVFIIL